MSILKAGRTGVTSDTPKNVLFGAGTIHKDLTYTTPVYALTSDSAIVSGKTYYTRSGTSGSYTYTAVASPVVTNIATYYEMTSGGWNFENSIIGATQGGSKLTITPEIQHVEADGAMVNVKGLTVKTGEVATMEINFLEINKGIMKSSIIGEDGTSEDSANFDVIQTKADIVDGDYYDNIAFVGQTLDKRKIMVIMENALCTSGFESEGKNKEAGVGKYVFESHADITSDLQTLPVKIYYPKSA